MDTNRMKLGLAYIFKENDKITSKAKVQLINFIEHADENQLKVLAMDGEVVPKTVFDEQTIDLVNDRFNTLPHITEALKKASLEAIQAITA